MERKGLTINDDMFGHPYTLANVRQELKELREAVTRIEKQMSPELHTITKPDEAEVLFSKLLDMIKRGQGIELIIRRV